MQLKEMQMLKELMRTGVLDKANFSTVLQNLVKEKKLTMILLKAWDNS
jgi:hypothetical protein